AAGGPLAPGRCVETLAAAGRADAARRRGVERLRAAHAVHPRRALCRRVVFRAGRVCRPRPPGPQLVGAMSKTVIVVPCYNEDARLRGEAFATFLDRPDVWLLFVNDGSTDGTLSLLHRVRERLGDRAALLDLERNGGKAEAVRQGLLWALAEGADCVAYTDADL